MNLEVIGNQKSVFGEGIFWDPEKETVMWVDLATCKILTYSLKTNEETSIQLPSPATAIVKYCEDEYLLIMSRQINLLNTKTGELTEYLSFEWMDSRLWLNDAKVDSKGRIWTGSVDLRFKEFREAKDTAFQQYEPKIAQLYMIDHDLKVTTFDYNVALSNGLAFHPIESILYHVDSATQAIWSYEIDFENTTLKNREKVYEFDIFEGFPDGMTIDHEGMLWTAIFQSRQVAHKTRKNGYIAKINPNTKELVSKIELPLYHVTSCQFGGTNMDELFITTASELLDDADLKEQPLSGHLLRVHTSSKGIVQESIKKFQKK
ncbi:SMP-30/gluconolactonase/LRE family protein [Lysinibacillus sp. BW-2-10]|uniref:SMP-30/gluconolactonase/LRE family protein n=1 Tax=Lysinibacillus sp. BW-2-10 TaxID=2590030 RepID=UPI00117FC25A|nr:SMP-30/gluconolactonase/LRE family protein [Lysinibacillus sp. BW-2-10]TSI08987.1 SMP-30/gluconolactonase/LRE family protein [Lysinibacillus sp. BW-2-10]